MINGLRTVGSVIADSMRRQASFGVVATSIGVGAFFSLVSLSPMAFIPFTAVTFVLLILIKRILFVEIKYREVEEVVKNRLEALEAAINRRLDRLDGLPDTVEKLMELGVANFDVMKSMDHNVRLIPSMSQKIDLVFKSVCPSVNL